LDKQRPLEDVSRTAVLLSGQVGRSQGGGGPCRIVIKMGEEGNRRYLVIRRGSSFEINDIYVSCLGNDKSIDGRFHTWNELKIQIKTKALFSYRKTDF